MQDEFQPEPTSRPAALSPDLPPFTKDPVALRNGIETYGLPLLYAMRDIMRQTSTIRNRTMPTSKTELQRSMVVAADLRDAMDFLDALPDPFDPGADAQMTALLLRATTPEDPRLGKLISVWTAWFGGYTPTERDMGDPVVVYVPVFDYVVDPMVEKALTVEVDAGNSTSGRTSFKLTVRGVGLAGSTSFKITKTLDGHQRDHSFQVVIPVYLALTEYQGPLETDIAYTARAIDSDAPRTQRPPDATGGDKTYVPVPPPKRAVAFEAPFLNNDALAEPTQIAIEKGDSLSVSIPLKIKDWLELGVDCEASAQMDIAMTFTKIRPDALMKRQYKGMKAKWEVFPA